MNENASPLTREEKQALKPDIHHAFSDVGSNLSKGNWGYTNKRTRREHLLALPEREETTSLLAFIGRTLASMEGTLQRLSMRAQSMRDTQARISRKLDRHSVSDGFYHVLVRQAAQSNGEILIEDCDRSGISMRARRVLYKMNPVCVSDISEQALLETKGCGAVMAQELLAWRDGILNPNGDSK